jgi:hypothetical protein
MREAKPPWHLVPTEVKSAVAQLLGSPVVHARRTYGGYGPSATYVLRLADGRRSFFKGTYPLPEGSEVRWALDREEVVYRRLGHVIRPWAPGYLGSVRAHGWHGLLLELVGGRPVAPWTPSHARHALQSYAAFHSSTLGHPLPAWLSRTQHRAFASSWRRVLDDGAAIDRLAALAGDRCDEARQWLQAHGPALRRGARALTGIQQPDALLHFDTRSDNLRLEGTMLRILDWPFASVGPPEFDLAAFAQSIEAEGGPPPETAVGWYASVLPVRRDVLTASAVGLAGYFADQAPRAAVAGLPRLRMIQRRQLKASLGWAARLLDVPAPSWVAAVLDEGPAADRAGGP